jgi:hypothetical protein
MLRRIKRKPWIVRTPSILPVVFVAAALAGCGIAATVNARNDMEMSKNAYKACLAEHSQDVGACEAPREAYEAALAAYRATSAGIRPGASITVEQPTDFASPPPSPGFGGTPQFGQSVINSENCIGAVVNGVCHGMAAPGAPMATCYGQMIGGVCTGPMF